MYTSILGIQQLFPFEIFNTLQSCHLRLGELFFLVFFPAINKTLDGTLIADNVHH